MIRTLDLFAGIGGFTLGLERAGGFETVAFCEIDPFAQAVLKKNWPAVPCHPDIRQLRAALVGGHGAIDLITGGFPCTDISLAKQRAVGIEGEQSGLWAEMARLIDELRPRYVIIENSTRLRRLGLDRILRFLHALGYDAEWHCLTARAFNAPHERDRLYIMAYPHGFPPLWPAIARQERAHRAGQPSFLGSYDGVPGRLDQIEGLSDATKNRAAETMLFLWPRICQETLRRSFRGLLGVSEAQVLLSILLWFESDQDGGCLQEGRAQVQEGELRSLWRHIESSHSPLRRRYNEQYRDELTDALCKLSSSTPSCFPETWKDGRWEAGIDRVKYGVPNQPHRRRVLGNAIVPVIAEAIGRAIIGPK